MCKKGGLLSGPPFCFGTDASQAPNYRLHVCICFLFVAGVASSQSHAQTAEATRLSSTPEIKLNALAIAAGTSFFAKLTTPILVSKTNTDDTIEAEAKQDIKQGRDVLLKKGSTLVGHVDSVQPPTSERSEYYVVMVFDRVRPKNGTEARLDLIIQAPLNRTFRTDPWPRLREQVGERISNGIHYTVLASSKKDLELKKGTPLVMKVVAQ